MDASQISLPLYVLCDDGEIVQVESLDRILYHFEAIDIENDEYLFWDSDGHDLKVLVAKGQITGFEKTTNRMTLQQAFQGYAEQLGASLDTNGAPGEIWARLQIVKKNLPRPRSLLSRLFGRNK